MSRRRARTWTPLERRVMYTRAALSGDAIPHRLFYTFHGICGYPGLPCEILPFREAAERIMREKGHKRPAGRWYHVRGKRRHRMAREDRECRSHYANRKYPTKGQPNIDPFLDGELSQRWMRWACPEHIWVPSDFNPNILVRRIP